MIDYKQKLYRLADIQDLISRSGLQSILSVEVFFETPIENDIIELLTIYRFLPDNYIEFLQNYNGGLIGRFMMFGADGVVPIVAIKAAESVNSIGKKLFEKNCPIAALSNKNIIYLASDRTIWEFYKNNNFSVGKIANSFEEFMNDCVFGERYLEFNGNDKNDEVYDYLKTFYQSDENKPNGLKG